MSFAEELESLLPGDLPRRADVIRGAARHLDLIVEANQHFNLTRITGEREAAIKHVVDSVRPWRLFAGQKHVLDAGTGAGFPGIPLALVLPDTKFTLAESIGKKARFVASVVEDLKLANAEVLPQRAEEILRKMRPDVVTARAVAPIPRAIELLAPALKKGIRVLMYKGPDAEAEIAEAEVELRRHRVAARVKDRYDLPDAAGTRTIVELTATR